MTLRRTWAINLLIVLTLAGAVRAQTLPDRFTLGRYMPGDVLFYLHGVDNPECAWLKAEWTEVWDALRASGVDRDITSLVLSMMTQEDQATASVSMEKWAGLLKTVRWRELAAKEFAVGERIMSGGVVPEYYALARGNVESAKANMDALGAILQELAGLSETMSVSHSERGDVQIWSLKVEDAPSELSGFGLELFRKGDVIGLTSGEVPLNKVLALMRGTSKSPAIVSNPRFREAIGQVPSPEDFVSFVDMRQLLFEVRGFLSGAAERAGDNKPDVYRKIALVGKIMEFFDVIDYTVSTIETDGFRQLTHEVQRLQPTKRKCALASCCLDRRPFEQFDRYIPADATGYSLNGLIDINALYVHAIKFVEDEIPGGEALIATWKTTLESFGFDPQRDLFSWWSGELISVSLPPAYVSPMGGSDFVWMFRVKDSQLATEKVNQAIDFISGKMQAQGQMLMVAPSAVSADGFREITHPLIAMLMRPVIGVKDEWLIVGSSAAAINKCLAVASGDAASIVQNERFRKEGLAPKGPVMSASFKDTSNFGQELGKSLGMAGMMGGMMTAGIQGEGSDQAKTVVQKLLGILMKLGPVAQKLDFYSTESSVRTLEGELTLRSEKVVTYKRPAPEGTRTTAK